MRRIDLKSSDLDETVTLLKGFLDRKGGVALVPTETVYGLIARSDDAEAAERIIRLKHRLQGKRFGWFTGNWRKLAEFGVILDGWPEKLAAEFCPGALTVIAPCRNGETQGFRVPDSLLLTKLLEKFDVPLLQTSANASGMPDARSCDEALAQLDGAVDCAVDGGVIAGNVMASTVVDATGKELKILRQGAVDLQKYL